MLRMAPSPVPQSGTGEGCASYLECRRVGRIPFSPALCKFGRDLRLAVIRRFLFAAALLIPFAAPAAAGPSWTFCVASAVGSKDIWITSVFPADTGRERLEEELKSQLERQGHQRIVAQCPQPMEDKVSALNAQTTAEEFNRKLGSALHGVPAREFPPR